MLSIAVVGFFIPVFVFNRNDSSFRKDQFQHLYISIQVSSRIIPKIDNKSFHPLSFQIFQCGLELFVSHIFKPLHRNISYLIFLHLMLDCL